MFRNLQKNLSKISLSLIILVGLLTVVLGGSVPALAYSLPESTRVCSGACALIGNTAISADSDVANKVVFNVIAWLSYFAIGVAILFLIWGGFRYVTANDGGKSGKAIIINALIGLVVVVVGATIVTVVVQLLNGTQNTGILSGFLQ
jgi:predicted permease